MANLTLFSAFDFGADQNWNWYVTQGTAGLITIESGIQKQTLSGSFTYPTPLTYAGTISATSYFNNNAEVYRITGLAHDIITLSIKAVLNADAQATYAYLLSGNDTITGSAGNDGLIGYAGNDTIRAGAGNDNLAGLSGNDQIDGGLGLDSVLFVGARANFSVARTDAGFTVTDKTGAEGTDTLVNVERIIFSDLVGNLSGLALDVGADGLGGKAYRLYQAAFNRTPDTPGLSFWMHSLDQGASLVSIAQGFIQSKEYQDTYAPGLSSRDLVSKYYQNILHRAPEQGGLDFWSGALDSKAASTAEVLAGISESKENIDGTAAVIGNGFEYLPWG